MPYDQAANYDEAVKSPLQAVGGSGGWETLQNLNLALVPAADWSTGTHALNGAALTFDRPATLAAMGPDGATGIVVSAANVASEWTGNSRNAPTWSVGIQDLAGVDLSLYRQVAVMVSVDPTVISTAFSYWLAAIETAGKPSSAVAIRPRPLWNGGGAGIDITTLAGGGGAGNLPVNLISVPRSILMVLDWPGKNLATYYDLAARSGPPGDIDDPTAGAWTPIGDDGSRGHLFEQRALFALSTMRLTMCVGGWALAAKSATFKHLTIQGLK